MDSYDALLDDMLAAERAADDDEPGEPPSEEAVTEREVTEAHRIPEKPPPGDLGEDTGDAAAAPEGVGGLDLVRVAVLAGVPLLYQGQPHRPAVSRTFLPALEATVRQTQSRVPASYGRLLQIQDLGLFTPESDLHHTTGRACDWEKLIFEHVTISPGAHDHASASRAVRRRYWAFAAICRSNSAYVLHGLYDSKHVNHIHQDNGISQGFNTMESTVKLCQAILNEIFDTSPRLDTDGDFGGRTRDAMTAAFQRLQIDGTVQDQQAWKRFLRMSGRLGFHLAPPA
jgi:hypothetical protein